MKRLGLSADSFPEPSLYVSLGEEHYCAQMYSHCFVPEAVVGVSPAWIFVPGGSMGLEEEFQVLDEMVCG